jgi:hypothetical protein
VRRALLLLLVLPALAITACGGDEGSTSGEHTAGRQREADVASTPPSHVRSTSGSGGGASGKGETPTGGGGAGGDSSTPAPEPQSDSGGGSAQFRGRGDNSVQESGSEADSSEFDEAAAALHGYLEARAAGRWKAACSYMSSGFRASLEQLGGSGAGQGGQGKSPGAPCAAALATLSAGSSATVADEATMADAGALRIDGNRGFLLFHGAHNNDYFMPMARERGRWKIAGLAASELR